MTSPRVIVALLLLWVAPWTFGAIGVGDTRDDVLKQVGAPTSRLTRNDREIFLYPKGGRVEFIGGKVVDVKGPLPSSAPATPAITAAAAATPATASVPQQASAAVAAKPAAAPPAAAPAPKPAAVPVAPADYNPAVAAEALARHVEKMDTAWGERPQLPPPVAPLNWLKLVGSLLLHFGITLLALKIAFKVEEMDALWTGVFAIAGIDLAAYGGLEVLGPYTAGVSSMGAVESALGALVMVGTIQKFCFTKKLQYAVVTAMSVKLVVQLCHMFLFVLLLNAVFG